jgi:hypothetical protein
MRAQQSDNYSFFSSQTAPYGYQGDNPSADGLAYGGGGGGGGQGGWAMSVGRSSHDCASTPGGNGALPGGAGYIYGGGNSTTSKLNFPTEVMYTTNSQPATLGSIAATGGQNRAYIGGGSNASYDWTMPWSNDTFSTWASNSNALDGYNKALMTKWGWFYFGVGGNTDTRQWKYNDSTTSYMAQLSKLSNFGEENYEMGQNWGYMLGNYNGAQNNWTVKYNYANDAMTTMGYTTMPKGHYGTSSGCCSSAAASVAGSKRF